MSPKVSVVIPAYNSGRTLGACLDAVYAQTLPPDEVIVIDDASTDDTRQIAERYPCTVITHPVNRGPAAGRNAGVREAAGQILFFCDADGAPAPEAIAAAVGLLEADPRLGVVHGVYSTTPLIDDGPIESYRLLHHHYWRRRAAGRVPSAYFALAAVRREVFERLGEFDENLRASEDDEFSDRMRGVYEIELTTAVAGRHDDDARLFAMLRKQFFRSQLLIPVARAERGPAGLRANSLRGLLGAGLTVLTLPLPAVSAPLLVVPAASFVLFATADPGLLRFVVRERGPGFAAFFLGTHFLVQLSILAGAVTGGLRTLTDPEFGPTRRKAVES